MKQPAFFLFLLFFALQCTQPAEAPKTAAQPDLYAQMTDPAPPYDSLLAARVGADEYGMKAYVMAFLKRGPNRSQDSLTAANLQKAHMQNINRMANEGKLVLAGPFFDDGDVRGIYIFNVSTVEEARALTESDPAIQAGRLAMELHPWYGSAVLPLITPLHRRLEKKKVAE